MTDTCPISVFAIFQQSKTLSEFLIKYIPEIDMKFYIKNLNKTYG